MAMGQREKIASADALLREHIEMLEARQEGRRDRIREIEVLIEYRDLEIRNLRAQLTPTIRGTE